MFDPGAACPSDTSFNLVGASRLGTCIRVVALQGVLLGLLTLATPDAARPLRAPILALASAGLKGIIFPRLLFRALRDADVRREIEPFVGYRASLVLITVALGASLWLGERLPRPPAALSPATGRTNGPEPERSDEARA